MSTERPIPIENPIWLTGSRKTALEARDQIKRKETDNEAGRVFAILVACVTGALGLVGIFKSLEGTWVIVYGEGIQMGEIDWGNMELPGLLLLVAIVAAVYAVYSRKRSSREPSATDVFADPHIVAVNTDDFRTALVWDGDWHGEDNVEQSPVCRIVFRDDLPTREVESAAYVSAEDWMILTGGSDPMPDWKHRHRMAWITLRVEGDRIGEIAWRPIPVEEVRKRFERRGYYLHISRSGHSLPVDDVMSVDALYE
ncbi:hypothetical protein EP30_11065 [Bifidobacterium sp. UTCIF-39]|uniref:hypothetical protein n=1 Tax=Bifidobacterium sp. UTCIF-39 TaxID=1465359 RepID=UPI00112A48F0|nr:hypothetical protein [Bifidobacterium sp. UTCIF-39]TPF95248.1 hypothetical protein EP30_11065 [Bifidobacterium sp. UTCIF-39]